MSSHREAPAISQDPVADNTDVYAFVSPDRPDTVTLIANFIPLEVPAGGPNFYGFGDDVLYEIHIDNDGDSIDEITYQFRFRTAITNPATCLYNTGPIASLTDPNWNLRQFYTVNLVKNGTKQVLASGLSCPPCNIGPSSTPNYSALAAAAVHNLPTGETFFAGQRAEAFYADLGAVFDLLDLRPIQHLHLSPMADAVGVDATNRFNVHSICIQLPKTALTRDGSTPTSPSDPTAVIGVYASAKRRKARTLGSDASVDEAGPWVQVSRLGNPLVNQIMIPLKFKDRWNSQFPQNDAQFLEYVQHQEVAALLPVFYPGLFPNLASYAKPRNDMVAFFLTGIPAGLIAGLQTFSGNRLADLLRLNMAIAPTANPNPLGALAGDLAGFPNGRRVDDDVFTIVLREIAGATIPLVDASYVPDVAAPVISDGVSAGSENAPRTLSFPYLGIPYDGFRNPS